MSSGTITKARKDEGEEGTVTNEHGTFQKWIVEVDTGGESVTTSILRKPESPDPTGSYAEQKNGRWKVGQKPNTNAKSYGKSPEEQKAIQRQHSQEMAIRLLAELREHGLRPDGLDTPGAAIAYVKTLTDHFEKDIAA